MRRSGHFIASAVVSFSLVASSTAAIASTAPPQPAPTNGWLTLSMLTPSGASVLNSAAVTAAQPQIPPAPPMKTCADGSVVPADASCNGGPAWPPLPVILIWLAVLGVNIYILTKSHHHGVPNSPA
jgi:hypothetical protein